MISLASRLKIASQRLRVEAHGLDGRSPAGRGLLLLASDSGSPVNLHGRALVFGSCPASDNQPSSRRAPDPGFLDADATVPKSRLRHDILRHWPGAERCRSISLAPERLCAYYQWRTGGCAAAVLKDFPDFGPTAERPPIGQSRKNHKTCPVFGIPYMQHNQETVLGELDHDNIAAAFKA